MKQMLLKIIALLCLIMAKGISAEEETHPATDVKRCSGNKPFPLEVRVYGCVTPPCNVIKGTSQVFEIDIVAEKFITQLTAKAKATTLGIITVPYELPADVANVCTNLMYEAYCPLYATEDVTYLFQFPIDEYPEIGVKIEMSLVDQDGDVASCFVCDIKVRKPGFGGAQHELDSEQ